MQKDFDTIIKRQISFLINLRRRKLVDNQIETTSTPQCYASNTHILASR